MRYNLYQLGVKHQLPQPITELAIGRDSVLPLYFHSIIPVCIAIISTDSSESKIYLELLDCPETFFYSVAFSQTPPVNRTGFLQMVDSLAQISRLCCYRVETIDVSENIEKHFQKAIEEYKALQIKTNRVLWMDVYGRN